MNDFVIFLEGAEGYRDLSNESTLAFHARTNDEVVKARKQCCSNFIRYTDEMKDFKP